ncbi:hypothetical protein EWM64_g7315 [Hericium alpestre]|uniref:Uncharacterized protein n=1 Tax=Hericium alpestre TaxID=135208 RepID=A0A4Y9ZRM4_9AGAM|nr:hypothetical protein EWM64_g7315 [Hericium alpestre]
MPLRLPACSPPPVPLPPVLVDFLNDPPPALAPVLRAAEPYACHLIYASSALIALIILRSTYTRFRAFLRQDESPGMLTVKWGKDRHPARRTSYHFYQSTPA